MASKSVLGIVLAGGAGTRLSPLTADRAKPAVPFGGLYRLIDFALSNLANGGIRRICVLTQYKSHSLDRHISHHVADEPLLGNYVTPVPAQQRLGPHWYTGSADAIFQSMNLINDERPDIVIVFGADHVYRMDPMQMIDQHMRHGAGVTVAAIPVPRSEASAFGIVQRRRGRQDDRRVPGEAGRPAAHARQPGPSYSSMGNYVFDTDVLVDALRKDADDDSTAGTTWAATSSRSWCGTAARRPTTSASTRCPAPPRGTRLLARRRLARLLLRRPHGPVRGRADLQPVQRPVADPDLRAVAAAGQVRARGAGTGSGGRSTAWSATA